MKRYEEYPPVDVDLDPLTWWKDEQKKFPVLESLARKNIYAFVAPACHLKGSLDKEAILSIPCGTDYQLSMLTC